MGSCCVTAPGLATGPPARRTECSPGGCPSSAQVRRSSSRRLGGLLNADTRLHRVLSPAAAQRLVEVDEVIQPRQTRAHQSLLRAVQRALRVEQGEIVIHAFLEALFGQFV